MHITGPSDWYTDRSGGFFLGYGAMLMLLRCACWSQGIVVAAISYYLQIWVIEKKGPVFLSMSMPLSLVFTMAIASFLLGEDVSLGR